MRQIKLVVEGQTERIFIANLIEGVAGALPYHIDLSEVRGGVLRITGTRANAVAPALQVELIDVGNDDQVRTFVEDRLPGLLRSGATGVFGLRDVFAGANRLDVDVEINRQADAALTEKYGIPVRIFLAKREVEAWFLSCPEFLVKVHPSLTIAKVRQDLGVDLSNDDVEMIERPARLLDAIYRLADLRYRKRAHDAHAIAAFLDFACLYLHSRYRVASLGEFLDMVDGMFPVAAQ